LVALDEEMLDRGSDELGLRRKVVELGAARDAGAACDLGRGGARIAALEERLDGGVQEARAHRGATLLLRAGLPVHLPNVIAIKKETVKPERNLFLVRCGITVRWRGFAERANVSRVLLPPTSRDLELAETRPYFLWWTNLTIGGLRELTGRS